MTRTPVLAAGLFSLLFSAATASGQASPGQIPPSPIASPATASVSIYVNAQSEKGIPLTDLKPDDLTITENNVPAKIEKINCKKPDPILLGILLDVSGSRSEDPHLGAHYDALLTFLDEALSQNDVAYVIAFDSKQYKLTELTADRAAFTGVFDNLKRHHNFGSTALYDAVKATANANFRGRPGRRLLLVVGDWDDNSSRISLDQAVEFPEGTSTTVYAIVDGADNPNSKKKEHTRALSAARRITEETGGLYYDVKGDQAFSAALHGILAAIDGACRVDYSIANAPPEKKDIKLRVVPDSKEISVLYPKVRFAGTK